MLRLSETDGLVSRTWRTFHILFVGGADAQESDDRDDRIHVGLNFEDEATETRIVRINGMNIRSRVSEDVSRNVSRKNSTPKFVSALPKSVCSPARMRCVSGRSPAISKAQSHQGGVPDSQARHVRGRIG